MLRRLLNSLFKGGAAAASNPEETASVDAVLNHARALLASEDEQGAARVIEQNLRRHPHSVAAWNGGGILKLALRDYTGAKACFERALQLAPGRAEAHANLAIALLQQGCRAEGVEHLERSIALAPDLLGPRENLAALLTREFGPAAARAWDDVLELEPKHARAHAAKAFLLLREGRIAEARELYTRARALGIDTNDIGLEEAAIRIFEGDFEGARSEAQALRGEIDDADIDWHLALSYLAAGDFAHGWPFYEARLRRSFESPRRAYAFPEWDGSDLAGGTLLIMGEQGVGDEIMFASCYAEAVERARRGVIECEPRLAALFARSFPQAQVVAQERGGVHPRLAGDARITYQIHAGSLPKLFRSDERLFPRHRGYLKADAARVEFWRRRLAHDPQTRYIGIAWSGGLRHTRRAIRSIPQLDFAQLLRMSNAEFVSLQHDDDGAEARALAAAAGVRVHTFPESLQDLDETAALISATDAVVSVCSAVVHLAGALGKPTLVLTPAIAEWRYLAKGVSMPWYPAVTLLRQSTSGIWTDVIDDARARLFKLHKSERGLA